MIYKFNLPNIIQLTSNLRPTQLPPALQKEPHRCRNKSKDKERSSHAKMKTSSRIRFQIWWQVASIGERKAEQVGDGGPKQ